MAKPLREVDFLALAAAGLCLGLGYLSRQALSPDGVSYLDLATAIQRGDWQHFVQGYWSPLLPLLTGAIGLIVDRGGPGLVPIAHELNTIAALGAIFILWWWARRAPLVLSASEGSAERPAPNSFGRAAIVAFLLCSAGLPRIEAVTPDIILLFWMTWLSYELIAHGGRRWLLVGALLGVSFLTKTSAWPWLLAAIPLRLWGATTPIARRHVLWSTLTSVGVMLAWIVPMSLKYDRPTLGSSGKLNYSWYIDAHSSRLPDTDRGTNTAYQDVDVGNGRLLTVATFEDAAFWTYQPWGDPTAWATKILTEPERGPTPPEIILYWFRMIARIFGLWLGPLIGGAVLPWLLLRYRPRMARELLTTERNAMVVMVLGIVGLLQFAAVHAEPRLIAPFGLMLALGAIHWCFAAPESTNRVTRFTVARYGLAWIGAAGVVCFTVFRFEEAFKSSTRLEQVTAQLDALRQQIALVSDGPIPIAVVGPAAPVMASAFWANTRIAMQVAPAYAGLVATLPKAEQDAMLLALFRGKVPMIWRTSSDGGMEMLKVPAN